MAIRIPHILGLCVLVPTAAFCFPVMVASRLIISMMGDDPTEELEEACNDFKAAASLIIPKDL